MVKKILRRAAIGVVILAALAWLFLTTLRDTNAEPYVIDRGELSGWTLTVDDPDRGAPVLLALQPPIHLVADLFGQIFHRTGQSLASPSRPAMPIVMTSEYASGLRGVLSPDDLLEAGRKAGLESGPLEPVCLAAQRDPTSGQPNRRFFLVLESAAFHAFRGELARLQREQGAPGAFDPAAVRPVLPVASYVADFDRWWPLRADTGSDCEAGISFTTP